MKGGVWREGGVREGKHVTVDSQPCYTGVRSENETILTLCSCTLTVTTTTRYISRGRSWGTVAQNTVFVLLANIFA